MSATTAKCVFCKWYHLDMYLYMDNIQTARIDKTSKHKNTSTEKLY